MLRASHRVLRKGGVMSFLVISLPEGVGSERLPRPVDFGPDWVDAGDDYASLAREAGFDDVEIVDVTSEYLDTLEASIRAWEVEKETLEHLLGAEQVSDRMNRRTRSRGAVREGLLRRYLLTAVR